MYIDTGSVNDYMKRISLFLMCAYLLMGSLVGCGTKKDSKDDLVKDEIVQETSATIENQNDTTDESKENEDIVDEVIDEEIEEIEDIEETEKITGALYEGKAALYSAIINDYISFYNGEKEYELTVASDFIRDMDSVMTYGSYDHSWLGDQNYFMQHYNEFSDLALEAAFADVNQDGQAEMFIVERYGSYVFIHDMWTIVDGRPFYVGYWDARYDLIYTDDGEMIQISSSGWNSNTCETLSLNEEGRIQINNQVAEVPDGMGSHYEHNGEKISEEEYQVLVDEYWSKTKSDMLNMDNIELVKW